MVAMEREQTQAQPRSTDRNECIETRLSEAHRIMSAFGALRVEIKRLRAALIETRALWEMAAEIIGEDSVFIEGHDPIGRIDEALAPARVK